MGTSTNAILFYGYCWTEETSRPWKISTDDNDDDDDDDDDWEARYARTKGCVPPLDKYPERVVTPTRENGWNSTPKDYSAAEQTIIDQHTAYWARSGKSSRPHRAASTRTARASARCPTWP